MILMVMIKTIMMKICLILKIAMVIMTCPEIKDVSSSTYFISGADSEGMENDVGSDNDNDDCQVIKSIIN